MGDAFGECFFSLHGNLKGTLEARVLPRAPWYYTDDTIMALAIVEVLEECGAIDQDLLARVFLGKYKMAPGRGYGPGTHRLFRSLTEGEDWASASNDSFGGVGSLGNGGAMRVAPLGAYYSGEPERASAEAERSCVVTHSHPEGIAGAIAVAVAASLATELTSGVKLLAEVARHTPPGKVAEGLAMAQGISLNTSVGEAARVLGNGSNVTAADTVPFTVWSAAKYLGKFEEAMWGTVSVLGDRDTTCAIVGGIVANSIGGNSIPASWYQAREALGLFSKVGLDA